MRRIAVISIILLLLAGGGVLAYWASSSNTVQPADTRTETATSQPEPPVANQNFTFAQAKKSAHYVSNVPVHAEILSSSPTGVTITFNFDLSSQSTISVTKDGQEVSTGAVAVSADKLVLSKAIAGNAGSGLYTVQYNACWPDGSCHDGQFQFGVQ